MELDDFKADWKRSEIVTSPVMKEDEIQRRVKAVERSRKGIRMAFLSEMAIVVVIYGLILGIFLVTEAGIQSYMYKIIIVTLLAGIPTYYRLNKSQRWINTIDYSKDVRSNLVAFLAYYKTTLRVYLWSSYGTIIVLFILFFGDDEFMELNIYLKGGIVLYMIVFFLLTGPYIKRVYGGGWRRLRGFWNNLKI